MTDWSVSATLTDMKTVGAFEAKTHFAELLDQVAKGETIEITRRGIPIAKLTPASSEQRKDPREVAKRIRELRKGCRLEGSTIRQLIEEGRRF